MKRWKESECVAAVTNSQLEVQTAKEEINAIGRTEEGSWKRNYYNELNSKAGSKGANMQWLKQ